MQKFSTLFVGLDVHKDSIDIAVAEEARDSEIRHIGTVGGDLAGLDRSLRKLQSKGQPLHVVYEAGPCGFVLYRHLAKLQHNKITVAIARELTGFVWAIMKARGVKL